MWTKLCVVLGTALAVVGFGTLAGAVALNRKVENSITRDDLLGGARSARVSARGAAIKGPLNFLLIGSDSRAGDNVSWKGDGTSHTVPGQRSDAIMLVHVPSTMDRAYVVSVPRDAYVDIPGTKGRSAGGKGLINSAYDLGGAPLLVRTVQELGGLEIQYPVVVDFAGLRGITDAVGGVDVFLTAPVKDGRTKHVFPAGKVHLDGRTAEIFVRQRYFTDPGSAAKNSRNGTDYLRQNRQQIYLRALADKIVTSGLARPTRLPRLLTAVTSALTVDRSMPVQDLALKLSGVRPGNVLFYTVPHRTEQLGPDSWREYVQEPEAGELFGALRDGTMDRYVLSHPPENVTRGR
jgi:LCP family protein required for cell wall assembly